MTEEAAEPVQVEQAPASWLDEFWSGILALPALGAFIPGLQDVVSRGFVILSTDAPVWYLSALGMAVAWGFGRKAIPAMMPTGRRGKDTAA